VILLNARVQWDSLLLSGTGEELPPGQTKRVTSGSMVIMTA
jgi:hypothetical protein